MSDNVPVTPGTGASVATDDCGAGGHVQIVKLAVSTDGAATVLPADATYGLGVDIKRITGTLPVIGPTAHDAAASTAPVVTAGVASAAAPTSVSADGDVVQDWNLRNGAKATVLTAAGALIGGDAANGLDVDVTRMPTDPFGANADAASATGSISAKLRFIAATGIPVTSLPNVTLAASTGTQEVVGDVAHDAPAAGNPILMGGYAKAAAPSDVSTDGDAVNAWFLKNGAQATAITAAGALIPGDASNGLDVDVTRVPTDPFGANADAASATGSISAKLRFISATGIPVTSLPALAAGTAAIGKLAANSGVDIGDVDVTSVPTDPFGVNADAASATGSISAKLRFIAATGIPVTSLPAVQDSQVIADNGGFTDGTSKVFMSGFIFDEVAGTALTENDAAAARIDSKRAVVIALEDATTRGQRASIDSSGRLATIPAGGIAHDGVDSGNPVKVGARAVSTLATATMVAAADRTDNISDLDGAQLMRIGFPLADLISERVTDTGGTSTAFTNFAAAASTRSYITAIVVYNSSATAGTIDFRDGTAGAVLFTVPIPAGGGCVIANGGVPLFKTSANTALAYDVSGALTTVTISVSGFKSKVV